MLEYSLIKIFPTDESHREFSYQVKKATMNAYITRVFGWDEKFEQDYHARDWETLKPDVILYDNRPIGTICCVRKEDHFEIERFYILPEYQNKGIGSFVLGGTVDTADRAGLPVKLMYLKINPVASLYRRVG